MMSRWMEKKSLYILSAGTYKVFINFTSYSAFLFKKNPSRKTQSPYFPYFTHFFSIGLLENIEVSKGNGGTLL